MDKLLGFVIWFCNLQVHTGDAKSEIESQLSSVLKEREQLRTEIINIKMETNSNVKKVNQKNYINKFG